MSDRNRSELLFEEYLTNQGLTTFSYEPEEEGRQKHPDYRLTIPDGQVLYFDIKEFEQSASLPLGFGIYDAYGPIREKINNVSRQFKEYKDFACSLVLFNADIPLIDIENPEVVMGAMLGDLGIEWKVPHNPRETISPAETVFAARGKMVRYKDKKPFEPQNTTICAIISLIHYQIGKIKTDIVIAEREKILGHTLTDEEYYELFDELKAAHLPDETPALRTISFENPYARIPLRRDLFTGPYDERLRCR